MIYEFPKFSKLTIEQKGDIDSFTRKFDIYADFSFTNLIAWDTDGQARVAWLNGNLVIRIPDYLFKDEYLYSILGTNDMDDSVEMLLKVAGQLSLVPEPVIASLVYPDKYAIAEDRNNFDYVYSIDSLCELSGAKLKNKRQRVNQARNALGDANIQCITTKHLTKKYKRDMLAVLAEWQKLTSQPDAYTVLEEIALSRLLEREQGLDLEFTLLRIEDKLAGFSINEVISPKRGICHFEKSISSIHPGLNALLIHEVSKSLKGRVEYINWEQDLGLPGLKHAKSSYGPSRFMRKYWIGTGLEV